MLAADVLPRGPQAGQALSVVLLVTLRLMPQVAQATESLPAVVVAVVVVGGVGRVVSADARLGCFSTTSAGRSRRPCRIFQNGKKRSSEGRD